MKSLKFEPNVYYTGQLIDVQMEPVLEKKVYINILA